MRREMDLVREILLFFEQREEFGMLRAEDIPIEGYSKNEMQYHINIMYEAGLIIAEPVLSKSSDRVIYAMPFDITWQGHEFLATIRDPEIWRRTKEGASKVGSLSLDLIWGVAKALIISSAKEKLGLDIG